jgi:hypothetical protein
MRCNLFRCAQVNGRAGQDYLLKQVRFGPEVSKNGRAENFSRYASKRNRCIVSAGFEVKKEIPAFDGDDAPIRWTLMSLMDSAGRVTSDATCQPEIRLSSGIKRK